jgi:hypothetical protein
MRKLLRCQVEVHSSTSRHEVMALYDEYVGKNPIKGLAVDRANFFQLTSQYFLMTASFKPPPSLTYHSIYETLEKLYVHACELTIILECFFFLFAGRITPPKNKRPTSQIR